MSAYGLISSAWTHAVPQRLRRAIWIATPEPVRLIRNRCVKALQRWATHDEIYDRDYYEQIVEPAMSISSDAIADAIVGVFKPESVIDVGCGSGLLLSALSGRGVATLGLEYAEAGMAMCRDRGVDVVRFDIKRDTARELRADVAVSTEVAEHLSSSCADRFVDLLTSVSDTIVLTAAEPGQGGSHHVNEQPDTYWIERFEARRYVFDESLAHRWRREWKEAGVAGCFAKSIMVFRRTTSADARE